MIHLLLKILGARSADALEIAAWSLEFRGPNRGLIWLLGLALLALAVGLYRRSSVPLEPWKRITLTGVRCVLFLSLLALLLEPVLQLGIDGKVRRNFVVLLDGTASMRIADPRGAGADLKRVAIAKGVLAAQSGLDQPLRLRHADGRHLRPGTLAGPPSAEKGGPGDGAGPAAHPALPRADTGGA